MSEFLVNSFQVPNALVDDLLSELSGSELKCYLFIVRKTRGWQKASDAISISQFVEGTKLSNRQIIDSCNRLVELGLVVQKTGQRGVKIFTLDSCEKFTSEKSSHVKKVQATSEKSSQVLVKKVHTQKDTSLNTLIQKTNNIPREAQLKKPDQVSEQVWKDFTKHRKTKKAPLTQTALDGIIREANLAGWTLEAALTECLERGWQGFKADWVNKSNNQQARQTQQANSKKAWDFDAYLDKPTMRTVNDDGVLPCLN